jgi:zinc transport system permease protein
VLLVAALMVVPVAASRQVARSFRATLAGAVVVGVVSVVLGLTAARAWDLAPGGTIVLVALVVVAATSVVGERIRRRRSTSPEVVTAGPSSARARGPADPSPTVGR